MRDAPRALSERRARLLPPQVGTKRKEIMASIHDYKIDTSDVLHNPSRKQLKRRIERLSAGLWKIGQCYMDLLDTRSRDAAHYSPEYFHRDGAVCLAYGMTDTQRAAVLETTAIKYAKFDLHIGVNTKSRDDVPHGGYSPERVAAIYAVPVRPDVATTQEEFRAVHVSYYMERTHVGTTKEERKAAKRAPGGAIAVKRAQLLDQLIAAIPMQQLQRAFESPTSPGELRKLQRKHGFKESNVTIYTELRAIFDEQY